MSRDEIKKILSECKTIAVIGLSREPEKESYEVSEYLQNHGFRIIPVNPFTDEVLGEKSYKSLLNIPAKLQKSRRRAVSGGAGSKAEEETWKTVRFLDAAGNRE